MTRLNTQTVAALGAFVIIALVCVVGEVAAHTYEWINGVRVVVPEDFTVIDLDVAGDLTVTGTSDLEGATTVGIDDDTAGLIDVAGPGTGSLGGELRLRLSADYDSAGHEYWQLLVNEDDLQINHGPSGSTWIEAIIGNGIEFMGGVGGGGYTMGASALQLDGNLYFQGSDSIDVYDNTGHTTLTVANSHGTYKAGLSVEAGVTTGAGLTVTTGNLDVTVGDVTAGDDLFVEGGVAYLGVSETKVGQLNLYGAATGSNNGGFARFWSDFDHTSNVAEWRLRVQSGNFNMGYVSNVDMISFKEADQSVHFDPDGDVVCESDFEVDGDAVANGFFGFGAASELTIGGGAITVTSSHHTVDTEGGGGSDDLITINGASEGDLLILQAEDSARTVIVKDGIGIRMGGDKTLDSVRDMLVLKRTVTHARWDLFAFYDNA